MNPSINVRTWWDADGAITQEVFLKGADEATRTILRQVADTQEKQIREALIALGWTPPNTSPSH